MPQAFYSTRFLETALAVSAFLLCGAVALCDAAEQTDGAELYRKHCSACHPDASKLTLGGSLREILREPLPGMPAFSKDKLSDLEVDAIASYLLKDPSAGKPPVAQPPVQVKEEAEPQPPAKPDKPTKKKKSWMKGFGTDD